MRVFTTQAIPAACLWIASLFVMPSVASACSCAGHPEDASEAVAMAFARADAVFLGEVESVRTSRTEFLAGKEATFLVVDAWKGMSGNEPTVVWSAQGEIACGYRFIEGGKYLVFAHWDDDRQMLTTSFCELNRKASEARGLIEELEKLEGQRP